MIKCEVSHLPGAKEADEIAADYKVAMNGSVAWVRLGLRLMEVKTQLPHGQFMSWCREYFSNATHASHLPNGHMRQLQRAKKVAAQLADYLADKYCRQLTHEELMFRINNPNGELAEIVAGNSQRQIIMQARDLSTSVSETEAQLTCEKLWNADPELRDQYEPDILAGELTYVNALAGMRGSDSCTDAGGNRREVNHAKLIRNNFRGLIRHAQSFESLPEKEKNHLIEDAMEFAEHCPAELAKVLTPILTKK